MSFDLAQFALLFLAAAVAGVINAVAGGGGFISFPALIFAGVPPVSANATNATALWPGSAASMGAYRAELWQQRSQLTLFGGTGLVGGLLGALLLLRIPDSAFDALIPYLMLLATTIFAFSPAITRYTCQLSPTGFGFSRSRRALLLLVHLAVSIYGGFFGPGLGILILAVLGLLGFENIHEMNALKTFQNVLINGVAVVTFVVAGVVQWPQALVMAAGAVAGGYGGAAVARLLPVQQVRTAVLVVSVSLTVYFFLAT